MPLTIYNTLSRRKEIFTPLEPGGVKMYTCGPTVYGRPHIGNYASFLMADLLRRWLEVSGHAVLHIKNITDVGHMVADRESGEDKVEKQAKLEKAGRAERGEKAGRLESEDVFGVARKYENEYLEDESSLNLLEPHARPRASETIPEMIGLIGKLLENELAYETEDGVYFAVQRFPAYGKLSGNTLENLGKLEEGVRIDLRESKKHPADFALWKKRVGEHGNHVLHWNSPWGDGFPGWHIECSAMSMKHLGPTLDIHTGGEDNIFPHHECEIAQSEGASGLPFVRYWLHKRRLNFGAEKMSKSLGNILALPEIVERGFHPLDLRYFLISAHYRSHTTFSWKGLSDAKKARSRIVEWMDEMRRKAGTAGTEEGTAGMEKVREFQRRFTEAMNADLNAPEALAVVFECMAWSRGAGARHAVPLRMFFEVVEHTFGCFQSEAISIPPEIQELVRRREEARRAGEFHRSDRLRKEAFERGFILEDLAVGTRVTPKERRSAMRIEPSY